MDIYTNHIKTNILTLYEWLCSIYLMARAYFAPTNPMVTIKRPTNELMYYDFDNLWADITSSSVTVIILIISGLWCIDYCLHKRFQDTTTRWYMLHCIANIFVVWFAFDNFCQLIANPDNALTVTPTYSPLNVTIALHMYHMLFFNNLDAIDWIHHTLMISIAMISYCYSAPIIVATNGLLMFLNGLPGGIDYFLLTLVKTKVIDKMNEKHINIYLNLCIRSPGVIIATYILYLTFQKTQEVDWYVQCIAYGILLWNSQYFLLRVIGNYVACLFKTNNIKKPVNVVKETFV